MCACLSECGCSWCSRRGQQTKSSVGCHLLLCFRQSLINCRAYQATASHFAPAVLELEMNGFMWVLGFELRSSHLSSKHNLSSSHDPGFKSMANNCSTWRLVLCFVLIYWVALLMSDSSKYVEDKIFEKSLVQWVCFQIYSYLFGSVS